MTERTGLFVAPLPGATPQGTSPLDARLAFGALFGTAAAALSGYTATRSSSAMQVTIGAAVWRLPDPVNGRAVVIAPTDPATLTFTAGPASGTRIDTVWVRQNNYEAGDADSRAVIGVTANTSGGASIPAGAVKIGQLTVPAGATVATACTFQNTLMSTIYAGNGLVVSSVAQLDYLPDGRFVGERAYVNGSEYLWDGSDWVPFNLTPRPFTPVVNNFSIGNGSIAGTYWYAAGTLKGRIRIVTGSTTTYGNGTDPLLINLPTDSQTADTSFRTAATGYILDASANTQQAVYGVLDNSARFSLLTAGGGSRVSGSVPFAFAAADQIDVAFEVKLF